MPTGRGMSLSAAKGSVKRLLAEALGSPTPRHPLPPLNRGEMRRSPIGQFGGRVSLFGWQRMRPRHLVCGQVVAAVTDQFLTRYVARLPDYYEGLRQFALLFVWHPTDGKT